MYYTHYLSNWVLCLCIGLLMSVRGYAFSSVLEFRRMDTHTLLPTNEVRNLFQDREGYLWIATYNGLVRYDGYSTLMYRANSEIGDRYIDGFVNIIDEDLDHNLWIGTHNGLFCLNKRTEKIRKIASAGLHVCFIEAVECLSNGDVWVGTSKGLYHKKRGEEEFVRFLPQRNFDVKSIMEDSQGQLWFGTWEQGLFRYDSKTGKVYEYPDINEGKSAHILFQDKDCQIWIGSWRYGLSKLVNPYDMQHYSFLNYRHHEKDSGSLSDNIVYAISQDKNTGDLWVGTRRGLSVLSAHTQQFTNYLPDSYEGGLPYGEVDALCCSKDGQMWVGMLGGGVCTVNTARKQFGYDALDCLRRCGLNSSVKSVFQDQDGRLWLGIMGYGLALYDAHSGTVIPYQKIPAFADLPHVSVVNEIIHRKSTGEYCLATWDDGVWLYDGKNVHRINLDTYPEIPDICIYSVWEDRQDNLWLGTRAGLVLLDRNGQMRTLKQLAIPGNKMALDEAIFRISEDRKGNIWVATPTAGVWKITEEKGKYRVKKYASSHHNAPMVGAMTITVDCKDRVWVGSNGSGVAIYDEAEDRFVPILGEYLDESEVIYNLMEDNEQGMWLTSNSEMYHVILPSLKDKPRVHVYTKADGLQDYIFNRNACFKGADGKLYFGGVKGLNAFYPETIAYDTVSYPVMITDLKVFNTSVRDMKAEQASSMLQGALNYASHLTLDYRQNNFSLDFSILNFINPELNKYEYQLEGYDAQWVSVEAGRHFAYYNNLPSGTYLFKVRGANANGVWSKTIRTLSITILPPPWQTWWAYGIYLLCIVLSLWAGYRMVQKRIRLRRMVEWSNMQWLKEGEVNHTKLQFFTNITHELLTPLTIISASVEDLKSHVPAARGHLQELEDNVQRLIRLIQQILEFRKFENNKQQLRVSQGNLTAFLAHSCQAFTPLIRKRALHLDFEDSGQEYTGYFDSDKLDKIVYNLLSNAAKYTPEGGTITVRQEYDEAHGRFCFSVNNPGHVMSAEKMAHLFERFYEGEYRKFHTTGTGIGLSLTKDLVQLHHGDITPCSDEEQGITFTVTFPIDKFAYPAEEIEGTDSLETTSSFKEDSSSEELKQDRYPLGSEEQKIIESHPVLLLVDDNGELREVVSRILGDYFQVIAVSGGMLALDELHEHHIDIVVSDVMMDQMDGFELCRRIKSDFALKHIPVILLTAKTGDQDRIEGYEVGADGYICKPLNVNVLLAKIFNLLKRSKEGVADSRKQLVFEAKDIQYTEPDEAFMKQVVDFVQAHLSEVDFDSQTLIEQMGMSRTTFSEKLKQLTGMTPLAFISSIRLQAAYRLLEEQKKIRVADLAYAVGFNDPKYFSQCFKKKFGFSPKDYKPLEKDDK